MRRMSGRKESQSSQNEGAPAAPGDCCGWTKRKEVDRGRLAESIEHPVPISLYQPLFDEQLFATRDPSLSVHDDVGVGVGRIR